MPEDLVTVVSKEKILGKDSHKGKHGKTTIINLLILVIHPSLITIIHPIRGPQNITRLVSRSLPDTLRQPFNGTTSEHELDPSHSGKFLHGLEGVRGELGVKGGMYTSGGDVPSEACGHGDTSVLEFGGAVEVHDIIGFTGRESEGVEESNGGCDSNYGLVLPCGEGCGGGGVGSGGGCLGGESGKLRFSYAVRYCMYCIVLYREQSGVALY
mmetsp:Transcript_8515/g.12754  ORF Transcript_8515/g.12754 Transcript_8515/m.12754 type:complete len:212 (+) Transcript_8515:442-1077(+)